jgi:hypothetical protein
MINLSEFNKKELLGEKGRLLLQMRIGKATIKSLIG